MWSGVRFISFVFKFDGTEEWFSMNFNLVLQFLYKLLHFFNGNILISFDILIVILFTIFHDTLIISYIFLMAIKNTVRKN